MKPSEWNEKAKTRVRVKFDLELDIHTAGNTHAQALSEAVKLVVDSFKKQELEYRYSWDGSWIEGCEISKLSCVPLVPIRYEPEEPEIVETWEPEVRETGN
jgi:hypothetical protein